MTISMQGSWTVSVKSKDAAFAQRFIIAGATTGNGTYVGETSTAPVIVTGSSWTITIENNDGTGFAPSADRIKFPVVSGTDYVVDIESNDRGGDQDFNDLVLSCKMPTASGDFLIFGHVSHYADPCIFNPCYRFPFLAVDSAAALRAALNQADIAALIKQLYPQRVPPIPVPPGPGPDPAPFRPLVLPLGNEMMPAKAPVALAAKLASAASATPAAIAAPMPAAMMAKTILASHPVTPTLDAVKLGVAKVADRFRFRCASGPLPGAPLRFQEYDRSTAELSGAAYRGDGNRENLGITATDMNGNYVFRFSRSFVDYLQEYLSDVATGETALSQIWPDVIVELLDTTAATGVAYESPPAWNVPQLRRIDLCVPDSVIHGTPGGACQGGRIFQAFGNIFTQDGGNTFTGGRVTTSGTSRIGTPSVDCGAWYSSIDVFGCFTSAQRAVTQYTIKWRPDGSSGAYQFVDDPLDHLKVGQPAASPVGPFDGTSGALVGAKVYLNIESDPAWVLHGRDRKAYLNSAKYQPLSGAIEFFIEGYDAAGAKVAGAEDHFTLYIDNTNPDAHLGPITLSGSVGNDCSLFTVTSDDPGAPLSVTFRVNQGHGFLASYAINVGRGNSGSFAFNTAGAMPSRSYSSSLACAFHGTDDDNTAFHDPITDTITATLTPTSGAWLSGVPFLPNTQVKFCTFYVTLSYSTRVTNGYNTGSIPYSPLTFFFGLQQIPAPST